MRVVKFVKNGFGLRQLLFTILASFLLISFAGCQVTSGGSSSDDNTTENGKNNGSGQQEDPFKDGTVCDSFFWGTWVRMDNGKPFEVLEKGVKAEGKSYSITGTGEKTFEGDNSPKKYIEVQTLGTFVRESDSVIIKDHIPYFRNGGTNLDYSLKIVGFSESRAVSSGVKGLKGTGKSERFKSFTSEGESDNEGLLKLKAPTINDAQTVTIDTGDSDGSLIVIPDIKVSNTGDYMGTIALVSKDQYNLKITGEISNMDEGYLYGNNAKTYNMTLTITNISKNKCKTSVCIVEPDDERLSLSSSAKLSGFIISTLDGGATKTLSLTLSFGDMTEAYIDTGIKVTIRNAASGQEWSDYVPLRFYRGLIPITVCAKSPEENDKAALNGFIIYPDGNNQFFSVKNNQSSVLFVPTFGNDKNKKYRMVFSGATVTSELSESTEMCYSVAPGSSVEKTIDLDESRDVLLDYINYGGNNQSEEAAYPAENAFIGYLSEGEIDYYTLTADSEEFYAPGAKNFYRVSFESEYGTVPSSFLAAEDSYIPSERLPILEEVGMSFQGWYVGGSRVYGGQYKLYRDVTLTARWYLNEYKITYVLNGGAEGSVDQANNNAENPSSYTVKTPLTTLKAPSRTGYKFEGWFITDDFSGASVEKIAGGSIGEIKLYARWSPINYSIKYELNGGAEGSVDQAKNDSSNPTSYTIEDSLFIKAASREGYAFAGWYTNASFTGSKVSSISRGNWGPLTLYARWLKQCTVTYESEHGALPENLAAGIIKGETDTFTEEELPLLTAEGWIFKGWYVSGEKVTPEKYVIGGNLTLIASWVEAFKVKYASDKASSSVPDEIILEKGSALKESLLPSLKTEGFIFTGWYIDGTDTKISAGYTVEKELNLVAGWEEWYGPEDGFVFVESGTFKMGNENGESDQKPVHTVSVSEFYISPYEVTQAEYKQYCVIGTGFNYGTGNDYPAYSVSWYDALVYCNLRSIAENLTPCYTISGITNPKNWPGIEVSNGKYRCSYTTSNSTWNSVTCDFTANGYRLPTEAEWEFAARGGNKSNGYTYSGSSNVSEAGWYTNNSDGSTHEKGTKAKNELNIYDMSGNVWEWCWDGKVSYTSESATDPVSISSGSFRVKRGGSRSCAESRLSVTWRDSNAPYYRSNDIGFRLVRSGKNRILPFTLSYSTSRGNAPSSVILPKGTVLTESYLADLSFDHYDFEGWFADGTKVEAGYVLQSDTELVAQWKATSYKINYVLNGGASGSADQAFNDSDNPASYTIEDTVTLKDARREGYRFAGWYKKSDFSGQAVSSIELGSSGEITLYAKWAKACSVTYSTSHGTIPESFANGIVKYDGEKFTVNELPVLSATGFIFKEWQVSGVKVLPDDYVVYGNITLTASWAEACAISYSSEKGEAPESIQVEKDSKLTKNELPRLKSEGYRMTGWFIGETKIKSGYEIKGNISLTAEWEEYDGPDDGFVFVESGTFLQGKSANGSDSKPVRSVTVSEFYISPYEVIQEEYEKYCIYGGDSPNSEYGIGKNYPAYYISWWDAVVYCNLRSMAEGLTPCYSFGGNTDPKKWRVSGKNIKSLDGKYCAGDNWSYSYAPDCDFTANGYRLPTEAEWEFAAKGGNASLGYIYSGSNDVEEVAWSSDNSEMKSHEVATKESNELELYDMSGNVSEWCWDWYGQRSAGSAVDPTVPYKSSKDRHSEMGGSYGNGVSSVSHVPGGSFEGRSITQGFRLVRSTGNRITPCSVTYSTEFGTAPEPSTFIEGDTIKSGDLPELSSPGCTFEGWYIEDQKIEEGYVVDRSLELVAQWKENFAFVEGGNFQMGQSAGGNSISPVHSVTVSDFYICKYEVTQGEYEKYCCYTDKTPSSEFGIGSDYPVYYVSWYDALVYCNLRSIDEGLTPCYAIRNETDPTRWTGIRKINGKYSCSYSENNSTWDSVTCDFNADGYRLPTEAEWEFAAKGGKKSQGYIYSGSNNLNDVAWNSNNSDSKTHQVGTKEKNELDLYDMTGNASELCWDWYGDYTSSSATNPVGPDSGEKRCARGGDCNTINNPSYDVAVRGYAWTYGRGKTLGFRLARSAPKN